MDLATLIAQLRANGTFDALARNPLAQFGPPAAPLLGATILPERTVPANLYREMDIRYTTVIANDGSRYSPAQLKGDGTLVGDFLVELGHQDIARELTAADYDALIDLLNRNATMDAMDTIVGWTDTAVNRALVQLNEKHRWDAIVDASVVRVGDNGYEETVTYPDPANHRSAAGGTWSNDSYDPYEDIVGKAELLNDAGYSVGRIITSSAVQAKLLRNANVARRTGRGTVFNNTAYLGRVTRDDLNDLLNSDGLPPIEVYDRKYRTQGGQYRYLKNDVMVLVSTTERDETIDLGNGETRYLPGVLGYTAIGRAVGQAAPGRVIRTEAKDDKPPRLRAEGWMTSLPVITDPMAIAVIHTIS